MKNKHFVLPKVYLLGSTNVDLMAIKEYLHDTDQSEFLEDIEEAEKEGLDPGEILCSFYAKACYASLTTKKNKNISKIRSIHDNIISILDSGHGSVIEHVNLNFMITNCSRIFCFHPETEILTKNGWKSITTLSSKDMLLTLNPKTLKSEWQLNKKLHIFPYRGDLHYLKNSQINSPLFTPDHIQWCAPYDKRKCRNMKSDDISIKFSEKIQYKEIQGKRFIIRHDIPSFNKVEDPMYIKIGNFTYNTETLFFWLGMLFTDGSVEKEKNACNIVQFKHHNFEKIRNIMNSLFSDRWKEYTGLFRISDPDLKQWICSNFGKIKSELRLTKLFDYSPRLLNKVIEGAILGDGNIHSNGHSVLYCSYEKLAKDWQVIFSLCGKPVNLRIDTSKIGCTSIRSSGLKITQKLPSFILSVHKNKTSLIQKRHQNKQYYKGNVYCPQTNNGIVYVRNKGLSFWSGNTHELVRHRVGSAFSQTSGRYVRSDILNLVIDPILEPAYDLVEEAREYLEKWYAKVEKRLDINNVKDFSTKKKLTSAMRRLLPNGQSNEIGVSLNLRALRHTIENRTSRHAEWEIRYVFNQIYKLLKKKYKVMFIDATEEMVDGLLEIRFKNKKV